MADYTLDPHPDFPTTAIRSITALAKRRTETRLDLEFTIIGAIDHVVWPDWRGVRQADGLWHHTCIEAFVAPDDGPQYIEFNFAASGEWAAYAFDDYRAGMRRIDDALFTGGGTRGEGEVRIRRSVTVRDLGRAAGWRLGLAAIIEADDGSISYWALKHRPGKPDFHNADCFAARLPAPGAS